MSKRTFVIFGLLVVVLAVLIPWLAFRSRGDAATGELKVPANLKTGQALFQTNCGTCHTLYAAGTDGNYAPNLDELLAPERRAERPHRGSDDQGDRRPRPQRARTRGRHHHHPRPHARRDPQPAAGQGSRRIRRAHRRRGLSRAITKMIAARLRPNALRDTALPGSRVALLR